jgi:ketosteroid isomerase-like protein
VSINSKTEKETVQELYQAFRTKDYDGCLALLDPEVEWIQNPGFPGGGHHRGASSVIKNVFQSFQKDWESFGFEIEEFLVSGHTVMVLGNYHGKHLATGKSMKAMAAHVYEVYLGKIKRFRQYTDTHTLWKASQTSAGD